MLNDLILMIFMGDLERSNLFNAPKLSGIDILTSHLIFLANFCNKLCSSTFNSRHSPGCSLSKRK